MFCEITGQSPIDLPSPVRRTGFEISNDHRGPTARPFAVSVGLGVLPATTNCRAVGPLISIVDVNPALRTGLGKLLGRWPEFNRRIHIWVTITLPVLILLGCDALCVVSFVAGLCEANCVVADSRPAGHAVKTRCPDFTKATFEIKSR